MFQNQRLLETLPTKIRWFDFKHMEIFLRKLEEDFHLKTRFPGFQITVQPFWSDESLRKNPHQPHSATGQPLSFYYVVIWLS